MAVAKMTTDDNWLLPVYSISLMMLNVFHLSVCEERIQSMRSAIRAEWIHTETPIVKRKLGTVCFGCCSTGLDILYLEYFLKHWWEILHLALSLYWAQTSQFLQNLSDLRYGGGGGGKSLANEVISNCLDKALSHPALQVCICVLGASLPPAFS